MQQLGAQVDQVSVALQSQIERAGQQTSQTVTALGGQVEHVLAAVGQATSEMRASVEAMRDVTFDMKLDELLVRKRALAGDMLNGAGDIMPGEFNVGDVVPGGARLS
jgi:hypothetical protein